MWLVLLAQWKFGPTRPRALLRGSATSITILSFMLLGATASAQSKAAEPPTGTVHVDVTPGHAINSFDPDTALGSSIDVLSRTGIDRVYTPHIIQEALSAGWGPITYRNNTELRMAAWHWNPNGTWSDAAHRSGYFTGSATPTQFLRHSYGYSLPHRGNTRNGGTEHGFSRLTDGDANSYWKSNPHLSQKFTGEPDAQHP